MDLWPLDFISNLVFRLILLLVIVPLKIPDILELALHELLTEIKQADENTHGTTDLIVLFKWKHLDSGVGTS